jgi:hypothetical protein
VARLSQTALRATHRRLAEVLEASGRANAEALATHFEGAGEAARAGAYYGSAAARATEALAFDRAARLYRKALELRPGDAAAQRSLRSRLAEALANAGRGGEAAAEYLAAGGDAPASEALDLRRRAALQLLITGRFDDGLGVLRQVLAAVGMRWPATPRRALLSLLLRQCWLWVRGVRFRERAEDQVPPRELLRLDVAWSAMIGVSLIDTIRGATFGTQGLLLALQAGEPSRVARALAGEAAHLAVQGGRPRARARELLQTADDLVQRHAGAYGTGFVAMVRGMMAYFSEQWRASLEHCRRAAEVFRQQCVGAWWEWDTTQVIYLSSLTCLGEVAELTRLLPGMQSEARERGDLYALTTAQGNYVRPLVQLAADEAPAARGELTEVMRPWSRQGFHLQHTVSTYRMVEIDLYQGDVSAARERAVALWSDFTASLLGRVQHLQILVGHVLARSALAAALVTSHREPLLRAAERSARRLQGVGMGSSGALAKLVRAGVRSTRQDVAGAASLLAEAVNEFDGLGMGLFAAAARRRRGALLGGDEGRRLIADADSWMAGQQIRNPARMTAMLVPGFRE